MAQPTKLTRQVQQTLVRARQSQRWTHCKRGHAMTPENTYVIPCTGDPKCRACIRWRTAEATARRRAERLASPRPARTHCRHGHPYTPENRYIQPTGGSACRICVRERNRVYKARHKGRRASHGSTHKT